MKHLTREFWCVCISIAALSSCHSNKANQSLQDTAVKTSLDTAIITGTPGPSGTEPRAGDTTQAHRDSLKRSADISDSSGKGASKP